MTGEPPIRAIIADDEAAARSRIRKLLASDPDCKVVAETATGPETVAAVLRHEPELLFLDVQMPGADGFRVLEQLGAKHMPIVVFVTAYEAHAIRAFDAHAADYLLKPFDDERFADTVAHVRERLRADRAGAASTSLEVLVARLRDAVGTPPLQHIPVRRRDDVILVGVDRIEWIEAAGDYVRLHLAGERHLARRALGELEQALDSRFVRVHRSAIVRKDAVRRLAPRTHGDYDLILKDGTVLRLSRSYREAFSRAMGVEL